MLSQKKNTRKANCFRFFSPVAPFFEKRKQSCLSAHHPCCPNLCGGDGLAGTDGALAGGEALTASNLVGLLDNLLTLGQDELDVAGVRHVGVDLLNDD